MAKNPVIDDLREEHRLMKAMFAVIAEEMDAFSAGRPADFERLLAAVEFCHAYPGAKHHPKEDVVYHRLRERDPESAAKMGDLETEHGILGDYTRRFRSAIERILQGENIVRDQLSKLADDYTQFLNRHMKMEETVFFPAALSALTDDDWNLAKEAIDGMEDPALDSSTEARLEKLRSIVDLERG